MANRYWIGGTGNWSDNTNNHWSVSSGGSPGASKPTSSDSVYFDANSFTSAGQTVTVDETANCLDMDWTGATNSPTLAGSSALNIYGKFTLITDMSVNSGTGYCKFKATTAGKTITTAGHVCSQFEFSGSGGGWTLQDNVTVLNNFNLQNGNLDTNGKSISCMYFLCNSGLTRTLTLGASIITASVNVTFTTTELTLNSNTSTIIMTGASKTFTGGGLTYHNLELQGDNCTITGSNTFNELKIKAGNTATMTAGTTQTAGSICSDTSGSPAIMSCASGTVEVTGATIQDITATGGATFNAINSINVSGNTGWNWITSLRQKAMSMGMGMGL